MNTLQAIVLAIIEELLNFCQFLLWTYDYRFFLFGLLVIYQTLYHCNSTRRYSLVVVLNVSFRLGTLF
jgi:uncharacterized membrane protein